MNEKYNALFTPWKIGNVEMKNRIVQCSMGGTSLFGWMEPNHFDKEAAYFLLNRAQDGVGLILPGMQCIRDPLGIPGRKWLYQNDQMFKQLKEYMVEFHKTGAKLFIQLAAGMGRSMAINGWMTMLAKNNFLNKIASPIVDVQYICASAPEPLEGRRHVPPADRQGDPGHGARFRQDRQEAARCRCRRRRDPRCPRGLPA